MNIFSTLLNALPIPSDQKLFLVDVGVGWGANPPWDQVDHKYIKYLGFETGLPFKMPSTLVKAIFGWGDQFWILLAGRYALGQCLNLIMSPLVIIYLALRLRQIKPSAIFSYNGGWPAGHLGYKEGIEVKPSNP